MSIKNFIKSNKLLFTLANYFYSPIRLKKIRDNDKMYYKELEKYTILANHAKKTKTEITINPENIIIKVHDHRKFYFYPDKKHCILRIQENGNYEPEETYLMNIITTNKDVIIDIGANFGWFTTLFANKVKPIGHVHSFEPIPETFEELKRNIELNNISKYVTLNNLALGENNGNIKMYLPSTYGSAFASFKSHGKNDCNEYTCRMIKLDDYIKEKKLNVADIKLIKCDVEGAELLVLRGARDILKSPDAPIWLMEVSEVWTKDFGYHPVDLLNFMTENNYKIYYLKDNKICKLISYVNLDLNNLLFIKQNVHLSLLQKLF